MNETFYCFTWRSRERRMGAACILNTASVDWDVNEMFGHLKFHVGRLTTMSGVARFGK